MYISTHSFSLEFSPLSSEVGGVPWRERRPRRAAPSPGTCPPVAFRNFQTYIEDLVYGPPKANTEWTKGGPTGNVANFQAPSARQSLRSPPCDWHTCILWLAPVYAVAGIHIFCGWHPYMLWLAHVCSVTVTRTLCG